jgi:UDP-N-acetyl-2-amino-2-deoxyglucuronate dehydrogenase
MSKQVGFGIIGAGNIAQLHAQALAAMAALDPRGGPKLRAVLSTSAGRANTLADRHGAEGMVDAAAFFARDDIQVVTICTPTGTHADLGTRAAAAGKHVIVEKPIDVSMAAARSLIDACDRAKVSLGVIFQSRFLPAVALIKRAIAAGRLGRLYLVDAYVKWYRPPSYYQAAAWRGTHALDGGGALINQAIHTVDLAQYFAGPVASVVGQTDRKHHLGIEAEDTALALVRYRGGASGVIEATTSVSPGFARRVELHGERGSIVLDGNDISVWQVEGRGDEEVTLERLRGMAKDGSDGASDPTKLDVAGHQHQFEDFLSALREGRPPVIDGREGLNALEIVLAVYQSAKCGEKVELPLES